MRKLLLTMAVFALVALGARTVGAQCCDDPSENDPNDCPAIDPMNVGQTEGCFDDGQGNCIGGSLVSGPGPAGCICVGGSCTSDLTGGSCADNADNACEADTSVP